MEIVAHLNAPCSPETLFAWIDDLENYPQWLDIVANVSPRQDPGESEPSWNVDLRGRVGPLTRTKRLRMVRTTYEAPHHVRFERRELDGRDHSAWVLSATVTETDDQPEGSRLEMTLLYDGGLFAPIVQRILTDEIEQSRRRLLGMIADQTTGSNPTGLPDHR